MNLSQDLDRINLEILNYNLDQAEKSVEALVAVTSVEKRALAHMRGLIALRQGDLEKAREIFEQALQQFGENVNLLRDLTVCQLHQQDMLSCRANIEKLELTLVEQERGLSIKSLYHCELILGKFFEEDARLAPALIYYDKALSRTQQSPILRVRALVQKARWQALYEPSTELSAFYRELISVPSDLISKDLLIELQHSLMLIELRLVGADHAWQRIERLGNKITDLNRRLLIFDFIEGVLSQDLPLNQNVIKTAAEFEAVDPYEAFLLRLAKGELEPATKIQELDVLATKLSWASYLRLLCLTANLESSSSSTRHELNRKIQLIVMGLDSRSQALWNQRLRQALQTPEVKIEFSLRSRSLTIQGKTVDLSKKKIGLQLIAGLLEKKTLTVDQAIQLLWETSFTPEHYHRLRMSTHRLNTLIHDATGLGKIIEVDSQSVRLRPEVRLKSREDVSLEMDWPSL